jgi:acyl-CoA synthetase (AMP-forming)/AMP-acid ligase II
VPEIQLKIINDQWGKTLGPWTIAHLLEQEVPSGEVGEIIVAGEHVLAGYLHGRGDSETKIHVGNVVWHRTGDAGFIDHDGTLWLLGRCSAKLPAMSFLPVLYPLRIEAILRSLEPHLRAVVIEHEGQRIIVYENDWPLSSLAASNEIVREYGFTTFAVVKKIPLDQRHQAKVDYVALRNILRPHLMRKIPKRFDEMESPNLET